MDYKVDNMDYKEDSMDNKVDNTQMTEKKSSELLPHTQEGAIKTKRVYSLPWNIGCSKWCKKYFWEGQSIHDEKKEDLSKILDDPNIPKWRKFMVRHARFVGPVIPIVIYHFFFWAMFIRYEEWKQFSTKYPLSIVMIIGGIVAGMTSVGGGAVAFPVMTLVLGVKPSVARDVAVMIQGSGMSCASFAIFYMGVHICYASLFFCSIGGLAGLIIGLHVVDPILKPAHKKIAFTSIWFSFAIALFLLNRVHKRRTYMKVKHMKFWKAMVLILTGYVGGIFTSFAGSGLDICSFSVMTLLFRVSEKSATPTSVILMASNSVICVFWRAIIIGTVEREAWEYIGVCAFIVTIGAPFGAVVGSHLHRQVLAACLYILNTSSLIAGYVVVRPGPALIGVSVAIIVGGGLFFFVLIKIGHRLHENVEKWEREKRAKKAEAGKLLNGREMDGKLEEASQGKGACTQCGSSNQTRPIGSTVTNKHMDDIEMG